VAPLAVRCLFTLPYHLQYQSPCFSSSYSLTLLSPQAVPNCTELLVPTANTSIPFSQRLMLLPYALSNSVEFCYCNVHIRKLGLGRRMLFKESAYACQSSVQDLYRSITATIMARHLTYTCKGNNKNEYVL
jgi:hypothetical protein